MPKRDGICYLREGECATPTDLVLRGAQKLSDLELVAIILGESPAGPGRLWLAEQILDGGPAALLPRVSTRRIRALAGPERAARLVASLELGCRVLRGGGTRALSSPRLVHEYARPYASATREHFIAIHLNARHVPLLLEVVSIGTLSASLVHPREVFRRAITEGCASLILVHNHPSGDPVPSPDDIEITTRLLKVGELVGIEVLDHVVLAGERYFSFREEGLLRA